MNKNIEIKTGDFFYPWVMAVFPVITIAAAVIAYQFGIYSFLICSVFLSVIVWFSKKLFEFNPDTKQYRKGIYLFRLKIGKWKPLQINCNYISFQRYEENINYSYGGLLNKDVNESVFELRFVYRNSTFKTLISGRDFQSVAMMIQLGKILSLLYNIEFKDYVKGTLRKQENYNLR